MSLLEPTYQTLATSVGCGGAVQNGTALACLRAVSAADIFNAMTTILSTAGDSPPFNLVEDDYFNPILPSAAVRAGLVAEVPVITGQF